MTADQVLHVADKFTDTEFANADRLLHFYGSYLRYRRDLGWFAYDETAGVWRNDAALVERFARATIQALKHEAAECPDPIEANRLWKWAWRSRSAAQIRNVMAIAQSDPALRFEPDELDSDLTLLNTDSGMIRLTNGVLWAWEPPTMCTRQAPTHYSKKHPATHPEWDAFLASALPDPELRRYVQMAAGYSITGDTSLECLFFIHGPANAGKSTFINAIQGALGDYAATVSFDVFLRRRDRDPAQELAGLRGRRFVASLEVQKGKRFAEEVIKAVTGGDRIRARFLYREPFEYRPTWKLWLVANDQPRADSEDDAFWRRIVVVPFVHPPAAADRKLGLKDLFANDHTARAAILAWLVEGARLWYEGGKKLMAPESIQRAGVDYREEADELADFYLECLDFDPEARDTTPDEIWQACRNWCERNGVTPPWQRALADGLRRRGAESVRTAKRRVWVGVRVRLV